MRNSKPKYILYLTLDGAGTHIIRSLFMELNEQGKANKILHEDFWAKASAALFNPNEYNFESNVNNIDCFMHLCRKNGLDLSSKTVSKEYIFECFEKIYNSGLYLDFTRRHVSIMNIAGGARWTQVNIDNMRNLIFDYLQRGCNLIDICFLIQIRNPMDHIASLFERFNEVYALNEIRDRVVCYLKNIPKYITFLDEQNMRARYVFFKLDDIVFRFPAIADKIEGIIGHPVRRDFYTSKLSINKWLSCKFVYPYLDDEEFVSLAADYGYCYKQIQECSYSYLFAKEYIRRTLIETKVIFDSYLGNINKYNSIRTKHRNKTLFPRILSKLLSKMLKNRNHSAKYNDLLIKHNKKY
jgi:hypothetical protein